MMEAREVGEGCGRCKSMEEKFYWKHLKSISFCVAFRADLHQKLQIPKKFAENMRPNFLNPKLTLRGPSGASWVVDLLTSVDGFFLHHGWEQFVNAYSLEENDILLFKYDRNSTFNVKIFDGEYEKVAAYFVKKCGHVSPAVKNKKKRAIDEVVGDEDNGNDDQISSATKKSRKGVGTQRDILRRCVGTSTKKISSHRNRIQIAINFARKKAASRCSQAETEQNGQTNKEVPAVDQNPPEVTGNLIKYARKKAASRYSQAETEQNGQTSKEVLAVDQNPPEVTENILALPYTKDRPRRSLRSNSLVSMSTEIELAKQPEQNGSTNTQVPSADQNPPEVTQSLLGFEKVVSPKKARGRPRKSLCPKITASRAESGTVEYVSNRRPVTDQEKTEALAKAASQLTDNSFFCAMQFYNCYKGFYMTIPARFASTHLPLMNQDVILRVGEKQWTTKFHYGLGRLEIGWKQFALDNYLEESDACLFKHVNLENSESVIFDVTIFRVVDEITPPNLLTIW